MILQINSQPPLAVNVPSMITPNLRHDPSMLIDIKDFMPVIVSSTDKDRVHIHVFSALLCHVTRGNSARKKIFVVFATHHFSSLFQALQ